MDPDLLRLLLAVLGVLLVLGIYLWDRYRRAVPPPRNQRVVADPESLVSEEERDGPAVDAPEASREAAVPDVPNTDADVVSADPLDPEPAEIGDWSETAAPAEPQLSMNLHFDAHGDGDYLSTDPALADEVERKLIVIHLAARGRPLSGPAVEKACAATHLILGDMSIYHRHDGATGRVLFSMASMVEPGIFPTGEMATFETPGLTLFTQLPGAGDGLAIYADMLDVANKLAALLPVEIQDEHHNKLTRQMQDHMRESIIEHRRKIRLARSRH